MPVPDEDVQQAVEDFVDRHSGGEELDPESYATGFPEPMQRGIAARCRQFLQFDAMLGKQTWSDAAVAHEGRSFGDFLILEELGRGGMGIVYLALQRSLKRRVALKVMQSGLTLSKRHVERFRREAEAAARLRHPGIVAVHSFTEVDGTFAIAMDYVAGRSLGDILDDLRLQQGKGPIEAALGIAPGSGHAAECAVLAAQVAAALAVAHRAGIAHRDLKPRNLMLDDNRQVRLLDFGLAKSLDAESLSLSGDFTGTVHYMSPEQTLGKRAPIDQRTDIFSLGVILYELLTLARPFDGKNLQQVVYDICFKQPTPIGRLNPRAPRDLIVICMKALEKEPHRRYASAVEMEADLQRFLRFEPIQARPAGPLLRVGKWVQRHRAGSLAAAVVAITIASMFAVGWWREVDAASRAAVLMQDAEGLAASFDFNHAIARATDAMALRPNDATFRAKLETLQQKRTTHETQAMADRAEASRLITRSNQEIARDREAALLLALEAVQRRDSTEARTAVLSALGVGFRAQVLVDAADPSGPDFWQAQWSPDGQLAATVHEDGRVELWSADGQLRRRLPGDEQGLAVVAFHPDAKARLLAVAGRGGIRFVQVDRGELLAELPCAGGVEHVEFDATGQRLLVASMHDLHAGPWPLAVFSVRGLGDGVAPQRLGACEAHTHWVQAAALSPDGEVVVSCGDPGFARLWRAEDGVELRRLPIRGNAKAVAFAADSQQLAIGCDDGSVGVFARSTGLRTDAMQHSAAVNSVAFAPDGRTLLTASADTTARLWRLAAADGTATGESLLFGGHEARVNRARFDAVGRCVVTACGDGRARVFDAGSGAELCRYEVGATINDAAFDPRADAVLLWNRSTVRIWSIANRTGTVSLQHPSYVNAVAALGDDRLVTAGDDKLVRVFRARTGECLGKTAPQDNVVTALAVDGGGTRMAIGTWSGHLAVHDVASCEPRFELEGHRSRILATAFAAGGARLLSVSADSARVWDLADATAVRAPTAVLVHRADGELAGAALSADASVLALVAAGAAEVQLWATADHRQLATLGAGDAAITAVAFRPDGKALLGCSQDGTARIWGLDGTLLATMRTGMALTCGAFADDGRQLLLGGSTARQHLAQLWDPDSTTLRLTFAGQRGHVTSCAFSHDGRWAITGSRDRHAYIWPTDPVAVARRLPLRQLTAAERNGFDLPPLPPSTEQTR